MQPHNPRLPPFVSDPITPSLFDWLRHACLHASDGAAQQPARSFCFVSVNMCGGAGRGASTSSAPTAPPQQPVRSHKQRHCLAVLPLPFPPLPFPVLCFTCGNLNAADHSGYAYYTNPTPYKKHATRVAHRAVLFCAVLFHSPCENGRRPYGRPAGACDAPVAPPLN